MAANNPFERRSSDGRSSDHDHGERNPLHDSGAPPNAPRVSLSVADWLRFAQESDKDAHGILRGRSQSLHDLTGDRTHPPTIAEQDEMDLPPAPTEPAPPVPEGSITDVGTPPAPHALQVPPRGHMRSKSEDVSRLQRTMPAGELTEELPEFKAMAARGSKEEIKELQSAIQLLRSRNEALINLSELLHDELQALREDRMFLERTLKRRAAHAQAMRQTEEPAE